MTSKNSFWDRCRQNLRRRHACLFINSIVLAILGPFVMFIALSGEKNRFLLEGARVLSEGELQKMLERLQVVAQEILGLNEWLAMGILILAVVCGIQGFGYLHCREKVDMYKSQPVSNQKRFFSIYVNGILIFIIPYAIMTILSVVVAACYQALTVEIIQLTLFCFVMQSVFYMLVYTVTVCAVMLTGTIITSILGSGTLLFYCTLWRVLMETYRSVFYDTYASTYSYAYSGYGGGYSTFDMLLGETIPFGFTAISYFNHLSKMMFEDSASVVMRQSIKVIAVMVLLTIAILLISYMLFIKRKAEAAGNSIAFNGFKKAIVIAMEIPVALLGALIIGSWIGNEGGAVFYMIGLVTALLLTHIIMQWIVEKNLMAAKKGFVLTLVSGVASCVFFCNYYFDLTGYDSYVPKEKDLVSASFNFGYTGFDFIDWEGKDYINHDEYFYENMKYTDIDTIRQFAEANYFCQEGKGKGNHQAQIRQAQHDGKEIIYISVKYELKNGKRVFRSIPIVVEDHRDVLNRIVSSEEFKETYFQIADDRWSQIAKGNFVGEVENGQEMVKLTKEQILEFREVYLRDLESFDFTSATSEGIVGQMYVGMSDIMDARRIVCNIYSGFDHTINYLAENEIITVQEMEVDDIDSIKISDWGSYGVYVEKTYTDKEQILEIAPKLVGGVFSNYWSYGSGYKDFCVFYCGEDSGEYYRLKPGETLPDFVIKDLDRIAMNGGSEEM